MYSRFRRGGAGLRLHEDSGKNWVYLYVADTMSDEQVKALQGMLDAGFRAWGPKAAHLAGKFEGMRKVKIEYTVSADQRSWSCRIPDVLDVRNQAIVNPGRTEPVRSTGILDDFGDSFIHADTIAHTFKDGAHSWDRTGRQSNWADFRIGSHTTKKLGWGCWTAHEEYGDKTKYPEQEGGNDPEHK